MQRYFYWEYIYALRIWVSIFYRVEDIYMENKLEWAISLNKFEYYVLAGLIFCGGFDIIWICWDWWPKAIVLCIYVSMCPCVHVSEWSIDTYWQCFFKAYICTRTSLDSMNHFMKSHSSPGTMLQIVFSRTLKIWLIWKEILWSRYKLCLHLNVNEWRNYECVLVGYFTSISSATVTSNFAAPVKSIEINLFVLVQSEISRCFRERARYWKNVCTIAILIASFSTYFLCAIF